MKIFDENTIEKWNFLFCLILFFRKFVTKNRAFGNNTIFLQQFFMFRGGDFPLPPGCNPLGKVEVSVIPVEFDRVSAKGTFSILFAALTAFIETFAPVPQ